MSNSKAAMNGTPAYRCLSCEFWIRDGWKAESGKCTIYEGCTSATDDTHTTPSSILVFIVSCSNSPEPGADGTYAKRRSVARRAYCRSPLTTSSVKRDKICDDTHTPSTAAVQDGVVASTYSIHNVKSCQHP